jgi:hypothetical protein
MFARPAKDQVRPVEVPGTTGEEPPGDEPREDDVRQQQREEQFHRHQQNGGRETEKKQRPNLETVSAPSRMSGNDSTAAHATTPT